MVRLTRAFVEKKYSKIQSNKLLKKEIDNNEYAKKMTHLFMNSKFITDIVRM